MMLGIETWHPWHTHRTPHSHWMLVYHRHTKSLTHHLLLASSNSTNTTTSPITSTGLTWRRLYKIGHDCILIVQLVRTAAEYLVLHAPQLKQLVLVLLQQYLPVHVCVHLMRQVLENQVHHDVPVEVSRINQRIHVQSLRMVQPRQRVPERAKVEDDLSKGTSAGA